MCVYLLQLKLMKVIVKELKEGKESQGVKSEAMGRLIAVSTCICSAILYCL